MPLHSPVVRDLSSWDSRVAKSVWEIYAPEKNGLLWSLLISYLIPSVYSKNFHEYFIRFKNFKNNKKSVKRERSVKHQLKNFNPFKETHPFYFKGNIYVVLNTLKQKIDQNIKNQPIGINVHDLTLAAASEMFNCFIEVYRVEGMEIQKREIFAPKTKPIESDGNLNTLIIFSHPGKTTFGFGMTFDICRPLQEKALTSILGKYKFLKENKTEIQLAILKGENFLISLINSDAKNVIQRIYKSPYILAKLNNAGYNMNPLTKGSDGLSAFHSCIGLSDSQYLYILYNYASSSFYQSDGASGKSADAIIKNLKDLRHVLETDFWNSKEFSLLPSIAVHRYREILGFNEYQLNVVKIMKDQQMKADDFILPVLKEYIDHFWFEALPDNVHIQYENYLTFNAYYDHLDIYTCYLLLDSLLSTKNKAYSGLVEPLFLMMMSNIYFPRKDHDHDLYDPLSCNGCSHRIIPFKYRINFLKVLKEFCSKVQIVSAGNLPSPADLILRSVESIRSDEFHLTRLKILLETVINIVVNDTKGVLTISRTLHVLGEILATSSTTDNFVSGLLLPALIPSDIKRHYDIAYYNADVVQSRLNLETGRGLFKKIQDELKLIYLVLEPVFSFQRFRMERFILNSSTTLFHISKEELANITNQQKMLKTQWDQFKSFAINVFRLYGNILKIPFPKMNDSKKYSQKIKQLQDGNEALNFVFSVKVPFDYPALTEAREEIQNIIQTLEKVEPTDQVIRDLENNFYKYVSLLKEVFNIELNDEDFEVKSKYLIHLKENLENNNVFSGEENSNIRKLIAEFLKPSIEATVKLETALEHSQSLPDVDEVLDQTYLSQENRKKLKETFVLDTFKSLKILEEFSFNSIEKALGKEHETSQKLLDMLTKEEYKKALLQHSSLFGKSLENKFLKLVNQKMELLLKKIDAIENILSDKKDNIRYLKQRGSAEKMKKYTFLMRKRYVMEYDLKSSLDMLLFECMKIMDDRKDLKNIYTKINDGFTNVDLRNILSNGNILTDSFVTLLDPDDLPSQLINKMFELINDKPALKTLSSFWMKNKLLTVGDFKNLLKTHGRSKKVAVIKKCPRWESYVSFLPMKD